MTFKEKCAIKYLKLGDKYSLDHDASVFWWKTFNVIKHFFWYIIFMPACMPVAYSFIKEIAFNSPSMINFGKQFFSIAILVTCVPILMMRFKNSRILTMISINQNVTTNEKYLIPDLIKETFKQIIANVIIQGFVLGYLPIVSYILLKDTNDFHLFGLMSFIPVCIFVAAFIGSFAGIASAVIMFYADATLDLDESHRVWAIYRKE